MSEMVQRKKSSSEGTSPSKIRKKPGQKGSESELQELRNTLQKLKAQGKLIPPQIEMQIREKFGYSEAEKLISENRKETSRRDIKNYVDKGKEVPKYVLNIAKSVLDPSELESLLKGTSIEDDEKEEETVDPVVDPGPVVVPKPVVDPKPIVKPDPVRPGPVKKDPKKPTVKINNIEKKKKKSGWFSNFVVKLKDKVVAESKKFKVKIDFNASGGSEDGLGLGIGIGISYDSETDTDEKKKDEEGKKDDDVEIKPAQEKTGDDTKKKPVEIKPVVKKNNIPEKKKEQGWFSKFKLKAIDKLKELNKKYKLKVDLNLSADSENGFGFGASVSIDKNSDTVADVEEEGKENTDQGNEAKGDEKKEPEQEEVKETTDPQTDPAEKEEEATPEEQKEQGGDVIYKMGKAIGGDRSSTKEGITVDKDYDGVLEAMKNYENKLEAMILPEDMESNEGKAKVMTQFGAVMEIYNKINETNTKFAVSAAKYRINLMGKLDPKRSRLKRLFYTADKRKKDKTSLTWVKNRMTFVDIHVRKTQKEQENCKNFINEVVLKPKKVVDQIKGDDNSVDKEEIANVKRETLTDADVGKKVGSGAFNLVFKRKDSDTVIRVGKDKENEKENTDAKKRDVAVSRLAILLGVDSIPKAKLINLKRHNKTTTEEEMEFVDGKQGDSYFSNRAKKEDKGLVEKHEGELIKQLSNLQLFDILTNQTDRHRNNVMLSFAGDKLTVKGVDNDQSFVADQGKDGDISTGRNRLPDISQYIDAKFANKIAGLDPALFKNIMSDLLSEKEITAFTKRLKDVKAYIGGGEATIVYDWSEKINKDSEKNYLDAYKDEKDNYLNYFKSNGVNNGKKSDEEDEKKSE